MQAGTFMECLDGLNIAGMDLIADMRAISNYSFKTRILAAPNHPVNHLTQAAQISADVCAARPAVIKKVPTMC